jgi:hypothetical protein
MLNVDMLTFREFAMQETLPLATIHNAVLEFLRGREDAVLFGAQAVNAYVDEPRMTQDIDVLSIRASELAQEMQTYLRDRFHIAVRVRQVADGMGYRIYQVRKEGNRHLVDLREVDSLPNAQRIAQVLVATPVELIARKVLAYHQRRGSPKSGTDWRDIALLLLKFPVLKQETGPVYECLLEIGVDNRVMDTWKEIVAQEISVQDDEY